ncbi:hypothetical protein AMATHDRAFT_2842 [Amanita thiersii Skay4041]|uniref:F-box domain-containing protein n=1 Tax=Amanita thiersii Skay4041 TaxID=703135 RepID=A0A2A9NVE3_9AGAR|nr:hypothetical protein AMATHDRAFT_2842 [Amanita thiersii Skay4041]
MGGAPQSDNPLFRSSLVARLPYDVLALCLRLLDIKDLIKCRKVCSELLTLIDTDVQLRYKVELYASMMVDGPPSTLPPGTRLERLLESQRRWHALEGVPAAVVELPTWVQSPHRLEYHPDLKLAVEGTVLALWIRSRWTVIRFYQLSSPSRGIAFAEWTVHVRQPHSKDEDGDEGEAELVDFGIDPYQDVLVSMERRGEHLNALDLVIRHLSDGRLHSSAFSPKLVFYTYNVNFAVAKHIAIFDSLLAVHLQFDWGLSYLGIWDWKQGLTIMEMKIHSMKGFTFLSKRFLLLLEMTLPYAAVTLRVLDLDSKKDPFVLFLKLPEMSGPNIGIHADLYRVSIQASRHFGSSGVLAGDTAPFSTSQDDRLIVVTLALHDMDAFVLCMMASQVLEFVLANLNRTGNHRHVPFMVWAPQRTRLLPVDRSSLDTGSRGKAMCVHGTKLILVQKDKLVLYDFNQRSIKREIAQMNESNELHNSLVLVPNGVSGYMSFKQIVSTTLPCRVITAPAFEGADRTHVYLGEDCMVLVPFGRNGSIEVVSF